MNRFLYLLVGGCVAGAMALAFFRRQDLGKISSTDIVVTLVFISALAGAACALTYSRWGRKLRSWFQRKDEDADDRVRTNARIKSEVRKPEFGPLP